MNLSNKYTFKIGFQRKYQVRDHPTQIEYEILALQVLVLGKYANNQKGNLTWFSP